MKRFKLFIDESGREHESHASKYYILLGCIIEASAQDQLENKANQIKYRYWKKTDIVFHSREIGKNLGDFELFENNESLKKEFQNEIIHLLNGAPIKVTCCVVDKQKVFGYKVPWKATTIIHKTIETILLDFLRVIYSCDKAANGIVIHEASGFEKDSEYLRVFNRTVTPGWTAKHPEFRNIREHLTSISFATKMNHDIECEIADLLSYAALKKYEVKHKLGNVSKGSYEEKIIKVLEKKLTLPTNASKNSPKYVYKKNLVGYCELPTPPKKKKPNKKKRTA